MSPTKQSTEYNAVPNPGLEEPIKKVTLNLWDADVRWLQKNLGEGWSITVRDLVRRAVRAKKAEQESKR